MTTQLESSITRRKHGFFRPAHESARLTISLQSKWRRNLRDKIFDFFLNKFVNNGLIVHINASACIKDVRSFLSLKYINTKGVGGITNIIQRKILYYFTAF